MATTYTYSITNDFTAGYINPSRLQSDINSSAILTKLLSISTEGGTSSEDQVTGGTLHISFEQDLSAEEKTILDGDTSEPAAGLLASHDGSETLFNELITSTKEITTTSKKYITTGMEYSLTEGNYLIVASGSITNSSKKRTSEIALFFNDNILEHTNRKMIRGRDEIISPFTCVGRITVTGTQIIDLRWKVTGGTGSLYERSLLITEE